MIFESILEEKTNGTTDEENNEIMVEIVDNDLVTFDA